MSVAPLIERQKEFAVIYRDKTSARNQTNPDNARSEGSKPGGEGLRGRDKQQSELRDAAGRGSSKDVTLGERRTPHEDTQWGADVRAPNIEAEDKLPEGLRRERSHPLNPTTGRNDVPQHRPQSSRHALKGH